MGAVVKVTYMRLARADHVVSRTAVSIRRGPQMASGSSGKKPACVGLGDRSLAQLTAPVAARRLLRQPVPKETAMAQGFTFILVDFDLWDALKLFRACPTLIRGGPLESTLLKCNELLLCKFGDPEVLVAEIRTEKIFCHVHATKLLSPGCRVVEACRGLVEACRGPVEAHCRACQELSRSCQGVVKLRPCSVLVELSRPLVELSRPLVDILVDICRVCGRILKPAEIYSRWF